MYSITTNLLSLEEAKSLLPLLSLDALSHEPEGRGVLLGMQCPASAPADNGPTPRVALLVRMPGAERDVLRRLGSHEVWHMNLESANLQHQRSFAVLGPEEGGLYVPLQGTHCLYPDASPWTFEFVLLGDDCVLHAHHCLRGDDLDDYLVGCQAVCASSGLNFDAARIHDLEALDAAAPNGDHFVAPGWLVQLLG